MYSVVETETVHSVWAVSTGRIYDFILAVTLIARVLIHVISENRTVGG